MGQLVLVSLCVLLAIFAIAPAGEAKEVRIFLNWIFFGVPFVRPRPYLGRHIMSCVWFGLRSGLRPFSLAFLSRPLRIRRIISSLLSLLGLSVDAS